MIDTESKKSLPPEYFEDVYKANDDPWNFASSEYEDAKYSATLDALPHGNYESAFEIGCSIGVLTSRLAKRCQKLLAIDVNETALAQARSRCRNLSNVKFVLMCIPEEFPDEKFDLILVSEVGYYLDVPDWKAVFDQIFSHLNSRANVVLIHWTPKVHDYPQTGDEVHDLFAEWSKDKFELVKNLRTEKYRLDVWEKL